MKQTLIWISALVVGAVLGLLGISWLDAVMNFVATVYTRLFQLLAVPTIVLAVITTFAMTAAFTAGAKITLPMAILLSIVATFSACGTSGVAGGSLLLVPLGCSLFGISNDVAMQIVGVGFIISVIQDSLETALNSSGDVIFTATAEFMDWKKEGKKLPL